MSDVPLQVHDERGGTQSLAVEYSYIPGPALGSRDLFVGSQYGVQSFGVLIKARYRPIITWLSRLQSKVDVLKTQNRRAYNAQDAATRWFMTVRGLGGFAELLGEHGSNFAPDDSNLDQRVKQGVRRLGQRLSETVEQERNNYICALANLHRPLRDQQRRFADVVQTHLVEAGDIAQLVAEFGVDREVSLMTRAAISGLLMNYMCDANDEIAKTTLHGDYAAYCESALGASDREVQRVVGAQSDLRNATSAEARQNSLAHISFQSSSMMDIVSTVANVVGGVAGTMPLGTDSLSMSMIRTYVTARTLGHTQRWQGSGGLENLDRALDWFMNRCGRMNDRDRNAVMAAVRNSGGDESDVGVANGVLNEGFQTSFAFNAAATAFSALQFGYLFLNFDPSQGSTLRNARDALDIAIAGAQTLTGVVYTIARVGASGTVVSVSRPGIVQTAQRLKLILDELDPAASTFLAVLNIIDGSLLIYEGVVERNAATVTVGVLTVGSGIGAAVSIIMADTMAGAVAGPVGVVCGFVAGAVGSIQVIYAATRPAPVQAYNAMKSYIQDSPLAELNACEPLMERATTLFEYIRDHATDAVGRQNWHMAVFTSPGQSDTVRSQLISVGFTEQQANQLTVVEHF